MGWGYSSVMDDLPSTGRSHSDGPLSWCRQDARFNPKQWKIATIVAIEETRRGPGVTHTGCFPSLMPGNLVKDITCLWSLNSHPATLVPSSSASAFLLLKIQSVLKRHINSLPPCFQKQRKPQDCNPFSKPLTQYQLNRNNDGISITGIWKSNATFVVVKNENSKRCLASGSI